MNDIFGPETRLDRREREISEKIVAGREILYPVFDGGKLYSIYNHLPSSNSNSNLDIEIFSMFEKDMIVPFDFIRIPKDDFIVPITNQRKIKEYRAEYRKFISRPDFFYVGFEEDKAHLFPVDLKSSDSKNINQISMMNSAMLYHHSGYMQNIIKYLKEKYNSKVILENGFFLFGDEFRVSNRDNLERYIQKYLSKSVQKRDKDRDNLGLEFIDGKPKLIVDSDTLFKTDRDFDISSISESDLIAYFSFVKGRLSKTTVYPSVISSINGFNGGRKPIYRLEFDPLTRIKTFNPEIDFIENEIEAIYQMSPDDIFKTYPNINLHFDERKLERLTIELAAKERDRNFRIQKRIEEGLDSKFTERSIQIYAGKIGQMDKKITDLEGKIEKIRAKVLAEKEINYSQILKRGSPEWYKKSIEIMNSLIKRRTNEIEEQKLKSLAWEKKDVNLSNMLSNFQLTCLLNDDFSLSEEPYFALPTELYLQLKSYNVIRVNLYNSFILKE